jgi:hypothetical protein
MHLAIGGTTRAVNGEREDTFACMKAVITFYQNHTPAIRQQHGRREKKSPITERSQSRRGISADTTQKPFTEKS